MKLNCDGCGKRLYVGIVIPSNKDELCFDCFEKLDGEEATAIRKQLEGE